MSNLHYIIHGRLVSFPDPKGGLGTRLMADLIEFEYYSVVYFKGIAKFDTVTAKRLLRVGLIQCFVDVSDVFMAEPGDEANLDLEHILHKYSLIPGFSFLGSHSLVSIPRIPFPGSHSQVPFPGFHSQTWFNQRIQNLSMEPELFSL